MNKIISILLVVLMVSSCQHTLQLKPVDQDRVEVGVDVSKVIKTVQTIIVVVESILDYMEENSDDMSDEMRSRIVTIKRLLISLKTFLFTVEGMYNYTNR